MLTGIIDGYRAAGADRGDLMSILMSARDDETGTEMTGKQLRDEARTLVMAGPETTGNTIAWACYLLTQHRHLQKRLQHEVDLVLAGHDASYETLARLPFTRAMVTEALRLYSPVWVLPRQAAVDVELGGYLLRPGSRHQELHRRRVRLDRGSAPAQRHRRPLAPAARRRRPFRIVNWTPDAVRRWRWAAARSMVE